VKQRQFGSDLLTDWTVGSRISFVAERDGGVFEQWGRVLEFQPTALIRYTLFAPRPDLEHRPENYFAMSYVLQESGGVTTLAVTQDDPRPSAGPAAGDETEEGPVLQKLKAVVEAHPS
jgi:Activator of Hsp90 ATPase homolog 1-like protein